MQRTKADLKDGTCQWFPLVCNHKTHRPCWFTDKNKVPFRVSRCWCGTLLKQDISLFTGAHLSKVMAWKIWMSLKGNRDYKAIIHFLSFWHCRHSLDSLTQGVSSLLCSHKWHGSKQRERKHKYFIWWWWLESPAHSRLMSIPTSCSYHNHFKHFRGCGIGVFAGAEVDGLALHELKHFQGHLYDVFMLSGFGKQFHSIADQAPANHLLKIQRIYLCTTRTCGQ